MRRGEPWVKIGSLGTQCLMGTRYAGHSVCWALSMLGTRSRLALSAWHSVAQALGRWALSRNALQTEVTKISRPGVTVEQCQKDFIEWKHLGSTTEAFSSTTISYVGFLQNIVI